MTEIFGYGIAHKVTGERLTGFGGRKAYDAKAPAAAQLKKAIKWYSPQHKDINPNDYEVVELCVYAPA